MFAITPRLVDDYPVGLTGDWIIPWSLSSQRDRWPHSFGELSNAFSRDAEVQNTDKEFRIRLDLQNYKPEEVKISSDNKRVTITAKHQEKQDNHGYVTREMTRVYFLPKDVDPNSITSTMNSQGTLNIKATKQAIEAPKEIVIPVEFK